MACTSFGRLPRWLKRRLHTFTVPKLQKTSTGVKTTITKLHDTYTDLNEIQKTSTGGGNDVYTASRYLNRHAQASDHFHCCEKIVYKSSLYLNRLAQASVDFHWGGNDVYTHIRYLNRHARASEHLHCCENNV